MKKIIDFFKNIKLDKLLHFSISFNLFILFEMLYLNLTYNILLCSVFFFGKELYDKYVKKTIFDKYDLIADYSGMALALILVLINDYLL